MEKIALIRHLWKEIRSAKIKAKDDYYNVFLKSKKDIESLLIARGKKTSEIEILVLGCGYNYPEVL
jgi:hypothetical protein